MCRLTCVSTDRWTRASVRQPAVICGVAGTSPSRAAIHGSDRRKAALQTSKVCPPSGRRSGRWRCRAAAASGASSCAAASGSPSSPPTSNHPPRSRKAGLPVARRSAGSCAANSCRDPRRVRRPWGRCRCRTRRPAAGQPAEVAERAEQVGVAQRQADRAGAALGEPRERPGPARRLRAELLLDGGRESTAGRSRRCRPAVRRTPVGGEAATAADQHGGDRRCLPRRRAAAGASPPSVRRTGHRAHRAGA